jgi:hypothetical protein
MWGEIAAEREHLARGNKEREANKEKERERAVALHNETGAHGSLHNENGSAHRASAPGRSGHRPNKQVGALEFLFRHPLPAACFLAAADKLARAQSTEERPWSSEDENEAVFGSWTAPAAGAGMNTHTQHDRNTGDRAVPTTTATGVYDLSDQAGASVGATVTVARLEGARERATASMGDNHIVRASDIAALNQHYGLQQRGERAPAATNTNH